MHHFSISLAKIGQFLTIFTVVLDPFGPGPDLSLDSGPGPNFGPGYPGLRPGAGRTSTYSLKIGHSNTFRGSEFRFP